MNRRFIAALLATTAVVSIIPTTAYSATTVSTSTNSVTARNVSSNLLYKTVYVEDIGNVEVQYYSGSNNYSSELPGKQGFQSINTGSDSNTNNSGVTSNYSYNVLTALPGEKVTFSASQSSGGGLTFSLNGTTLFSVGRSEVTYSGAAITFTMPGDLGNKKIKLCHNYRGSHVSDSKYYVDYTLLSLTNIDVGNPASEPMAIIQQALLNFKAKNETNIDEIQTLANNCADLSKVTVNVTQTGKAEATEKAEGYISGKVIVISKSDSNKKLETTFNLQIPKSGQSANTLMESYKNSIKNFRGTNSTTQNNVLDLVKKTNDDISVSISNFNRINATDKTTGTITGTLNITGVPSYPFTIEIPKLAQSTDTAKDIIKSVTENMVVDNSTDQSTVQALVNSSIDTTAVTANVSITEKTNATENKKGILIGNVAISDKTGAKADVSINREIETETQSLDTVKALFEAYLNSMEKSNTTTENDILNGVRITNEDITAKISGFKVAVATETSRGNIQGVIEIEDNSTGENTTILINLIIDYLHQSPNTVAKLYEEASKAYIASNSTTAQDIIDMISITNKDITVTEDSFKLIPSTDESKGQITVNLTISDGKTKVIQPIKIVIENQPQELATALAEVQKFLAEQKNKTTNSTDTDDLLIQINQAITNSKIFVSYSNVEGERIEKVNATEDTKGYIKGKLLLADSEGHKVKVPVDLEIAKLSQSLDNAENKVNQYLNDLKATNELKESGILFDIQDLLDKDIKVSIEDYLVKESTESNKGNITGKIILTKEGNTKEISIYKEIDLEAQSMDNVIELINAKLKDMYLSNTSTSNELEEELNKCLTNAEGSKFKIKIADDDFRIVKATQELDGSVRGKITLFDSDMNIQYISYNIVIKQLPQTLNNAIEKVNKILEKYSPNNNTKEEDFNSLMDSALTKVEGSEITIDVKKFKLIESTKKTTGSLEVEITISDNNNIEEINKTFEIAKINQSIDEAEESINKLLPNFEGNNTTKVDDLINKIKDELGENINIDVKDFKIKEATNKEEGKITLIILIKDINTSEEIEKTLEIKINKLEETLDEAQDTIDKMLADLKANNNTKEEELTNKIKDSVGSNINIEIKDFKIKEATSREEGKITLIVLIKNINTGEEIEKTLEIKINKLEETLDEAQDTIDEMLSDLKANNNTKEEELTNKIKDSVGSNINIEIKDFKIKEATNREEGKITLIVLIKNINTGEEIEKTLEIKINKLEETLDEAQDTIDKMLSDFKANNNTKEEELTNKIKDSVGSNINIEIKDFKIKKSTSKEEGKITGIVIIKDNRTGKLIEKSIDIIIEKLADNSTSSGGGSSSSSSDKNKEEINIGNDIKSVDQLFDMIKKSDISILGISRDNLLSSVTLEKDKENTIVEDNNNISFEGVSSKVSKVHLPYTEIKATDGQAINGELSVLIADNNIIGMGIKGQEKYGKNTNIKVNTKLPEDGLHIYTNVKDIGKYIEIKDKAEKVDEGIVLKGINSDNYLVTTKPLSQDKQADIGWYKNENNEWVYLKDFDTEKGWINENGNWYFNDLENGKMKTGWIKSPYNNKWFYLNEKSDGAKGKMETGWQKVNDKWYYLNSDGSMAKDTYVNGYYLDGSGSWVK